MKRRVYQLPTLVRAERVGKRPTNKVKRLSLAEMAYFSATARLAAVSLRIADAAAAVLTIEDRRALANWHGFEEHEHLALRLMLRRVLALKRAAGIT